MKSFSFFLVILGLVIFTCVGGQPKQVRPISAATVVASDESEVAHVERIFFERNAYDPKAGTDYLVVTVGSSLECSLAECSTLRRLRVED